MSYVEGESREQRILFPEILDDYISEDNLVRFIDAFVEGLEMEELGFEGTAPKGIGRPPYDPRDLLKLYIYGYLNRVRTGRRLERECQRNVELMWLMRKLRPDFKTITDFRKDNRKAFRGVFRQFVLLCKGLGLVGGELVAVDGSKFKAVNSGQRNFSAKKLEERLKKICRVPADSEHEIRESKMAIDRRLKPPGGSDGQTESMERREALSDRQRSAESKRAARTNRQTASGLRRIDLPMAG